MKTNVVKSAPNRIKTELLQAREELEELSFRRREVNKLPLAQRIIKLHEIILMTGKSIFLNHLIYSLQQELHENQSTEKSLHF